MTNTVGRHGRFLGAVADVVLKHPAAILWFFLLLAVLSCISAYFGLSLNTAQNALVSNKLDYNRRYHEYRIEFGDQEYIYLVIEVTDLPTAKAVADDVALVLQALQEQGTIDRFFHRLALDDLTRNALVAFASAIPRASRTCAKSGETRASRHRPATAVSSCG